MSCITRLHWIHYPMQLHLYSRLSLMAFVLCLLVGCKSYYLEENQPVWKNNNLSDKPSYDDTLPLRILSYNIEKAKEIDTAIAELDSMNALRSIEICLLQEMDEQGVVRIAESLGFNYVYFPITHYRKGHRHMGNAILARGEILSSHKLIFPTRKLLDKARRMSCSALVSIGSRTVRVHSLHLETITMRRGKRLQQLDTILEEVTAEQEEISHFILGGDFNSLFKKDVTMMTAKAEEAYLEWATPYVGRTGRVPLNIIKPQLDHIFIKGFDLVDYGKCETCAASDHLPVWADVIPR